ncbi:MAG: hypothetical protein ACJ76D_06995, partial [Solirubrobacterales bacterium]
MNHLKILALAAIAAAALAAFLGAGTASATVLCENNQTTGCQKDVLVGAKLDLSAEDSITLTGPFGIVIATCTISTMEAELTSTGGSAATTIGSITKLTFEGCNRNVTSTTTTGTLEI